MPEGSATLFVQGCAINMALIASIGVQNIFILRQAILGQHLVLVVVVCWLVDMVVITLGILGFGAILAGDTRLASATAWAGAGFLLVYAARRLGAACGRVPSALELRARSSRWPATLATALAISLLNPQIYLDAFVLMGGMAAQMPTAPRLAFALGALSASIGWFAGLAWASVQLCSMLLARRFWRVVDLLACVCMTAMALVIVWGQDAGPRALLRALWPG